MNTDKTYDPDAIANWFDGRASEYDETYYRQRQDMHCADEYRARHVIELVESIRPSLILDVGCGTGIVAHRLIERGYNVVGFDLSPGMIQEAQRKSDELGYDPQRFSVGDIHDAEMLSRYRDMGVDLVIANGVFPYIDAPQLAHHNIAAILKTGDHYIGSYANKLFNMFSLNRFTVDFHVEMAQSIGLDAQSLEAVRKGVGSLLTNPKSPKHIQLSASNRLYSRADNPLTIGDELLEHCLTLLELRFYKFHAFAPLVAEQNSDLKSKFVAISQQLEDQLFKDWRAYFLTTSFICVARKS